MKKCSLYLRVSTEEQAKPGHHSIATQEELCLLKAKELGYEVIHIHKDEGFSGKLVTRPALNKLKEDIVKNDINALIVLHTDRLARNAVLHMNLKADMKQKSIKLISVFQGEVQYTADGDFSDNMMALVNEHYSNLIGEKTKNGLDKKAQTGWYPGEAPIGYKNIGIGLENRNRMVAIDKERAPYIKMIFDLYVSRKCPLEEIQQIIAKKGLKTKRGKVLHLSKVCYIIQNPFYMGKFRWGQKEYEGRHKPIISEEQFEMAQQIRKSRMGTRNYERKHNFLLASYIVCDCCGRKFTAEHHTKHKNTYSYYHCTKGRTCDNTAVRVKDLERLVDNKFKRIQLTDEFKTKLLIKLKQRYDNHKKEIGLDAKKLLTKKQAIEYKRDNMEQNLFKGIIDSEVYNRNKGIFDEELKQIESELAEFNQQKQIQLPAFEEIIEFSDDAYKTFKSSCYEVKRRYLGFYWEKFIVKDKSIVQAVPTPLFKALMELQQKQKPPTKGTIVKSRELKLKKFDNQFINLSTWGG